MNYNFVMLLVSVAVGFYLAACAVCASGKKQKIFGVVSITCFIFAYTLAGHGFDAAAYFQKLLK